MTRLKNTTDKIIEQLYLLIDYCELYDRSTNREIHFISIAGRLYNILVEILCSKEGSEFIRGHGKIFPSCSTKPPDPQNGAFQQFHPLIALTVPPGSYQAVGSTNSIGYYHLKLGNYLGQDVLSSSDNAYNFSRQYLLKTIRNLDGYAHNYGLPDQQYSNMFDYGHGMQMFNSEQDQPVNQNLVPATVRQIAYETTLALNKILQDEAIAKLLSDFNLNGPFSLVMFGRTAQHS